MAQHPMLYLGEGYNSLMVVNQGKIIWTYQTGVGWEYDDAWMLSNGNILFSRMQYVAEITHDKRVLWRFDALPGTEIHTCQPIGREKILFILNGLPPKLMVIKKKLNRVEVEHALPRPGMERHWVHAEFRRVRYTAQDTELPDAGPSMASPCVPLMLAPPWGPYTPSRPCASLGAAPN